MYKYCITYFFFLSWRMCVSPQKCPGAARPPHMSCLGTDYTPRSVNMSIRRTSRPTSRRTSRHTCRSDEREEILLRRLEIERERSYNWSAGVLAWWRFMTNGLSKYCLFLFLYHLKLFLGIGTIKDNDIFDKAKFLK